MMNKLYKFSSSSLLMIIFLAIGCDDYLKEDSGDLLIPQKVDEFSPMLYAEGYPSNFNDNVAWFKLMTDDVEMSHLEIDSAGTQYLEKDGNSFDILKGGEGRQAYIWSKDIGEKITDNFWGARYENILACNVIIEALPTMKYVEQDSGKYNYLAAQAYALRAYHYWCLVNTYALPYSQQNLDKPGVIIRTNPKVDIQARGRSSIHEVYNLINADLQKAEKYIEVSEISENRHLLTQPAILFLASRIALFQENWEEVIRVSELFLGNHSVVFDLNTVDEEDLGTNPDYNGFCMMDGMMNGEIIFTFGSNSTYYDFLALSLSGSQYGLGFRPSREGDQSLLGSYEEDDLRLQAFFKKDVPAKEPTWPWEEYEEIRYNYQYPIKYCRSYGDAAEKPNDKLYHENWRSVEVMLNLAEAYTRKTNSVNKNAIDLINTLRKGRIKSDRYAEKQVSNFTSSEDLLQFIWAERRRELCFEEAMRFWDLRRQGMPQIEHKWYTSWNSYETYLLKKESPNYVLEIPDSELNYNEACINNDREVVSAK